MNILPRVKISHINTANDHTSLLTENLPFKSDSGAIQLIGRLPPPL